MFSFALREADDAPMLAPVKSLDFNAPSMELDKKAKVSANQSKNLKDFSGSLEPVITEPAFSATVRDFRIKNPLQTRLPVTFLADGKKVTLNPGQHFTLKQTENVRVKFSRGGSFGFTDDLLSAGNYEFSVTRKEGWKLAN
jgi:hypothetical protein